VACSMEGNLQDCEETWGCVWRRAGHRGTPCILHDPNPEKDVPAFHEALGQIKAASNDATLPLYGTIFPARVTQELYASLGGGHFKLKLGAATFLGPVNFDAKWFMKMVDLDGAIFKQAASFQHAVFRNVVRFVGARFERDALFANAIFEDSVDFDHFSCQRADFALAQFKSMVSLRGTPDRQLFNETTEVIFDEARFIEPNRVRLAYVDFKQCSLLKTDLRGIDFSGVRWGETGKWSKRIALFHKQPEEQIRLELENAYRQVRQSYEDRRDYGRAGDFYFGEMEQKWKGSGGFLATLYRFSSSYGHSPGRAFVVLLLLLGLDAAFVTLSGVKPASGAAYNLAAGADGTGPSFLEAWWNALWFYVLKTVAFSQPSVVPSLPIADAFSSLMRIVISVQAALFALAVNRKFKR